MSQLIIKGLYAGYEKEIEILKGIDIEINSGEVLGVIGLNGSGKSTFGKAIMNILPFRNGHLILDGEDISICAPNKLSKKGLAIMRQGGQVFSTMTISENLDIAFGTQKDQSYKDLIYNMIPLLRDHEKFLFRRTADKLSGGQRHQLALAMSLASKPSFIILDEPSAGLSPLAVESMYSLLQEIKNSLKLTIVLIEQNINKAISFCNRCILLSQGEIGKEYESMEIPQMKMEILKDLGL